jgi:hypothetical protein
MHAYKRMICAGTKDEYDHITIANQQFNVLQAHAEDQAT